MTVVISIGGSIIAPTFNADTFIAYAEVIKEVAQDNTVLAVSGGGKAARYYVEIACSMKANKPACDFRHIVLTQTHTKGDFKHY